MSGDRYNPIHQQMVTVLGYECVWDNEIGDYLTIRDIIILLNEQEKKLKSLQQDSQDYEDAVFNWFFENWDSLSEEQKQYAHLEIGVEIDYE